MKTTINELSWHQKQAARRAWRTRNKPAHILEPFPLTTSLCGMPYHSITVWAEIDHAMEGKADPVCKRCLREARKRAAR